MNSCPSSSLSMPQTSDNSATRSPQRESAEPATPEQFSGTKQLDLANLQLQLRIHMEQMFEQGLLDYYFKQLELLEASGNQGFVADIIQVFCCDAERIFRSLENLLAEERTSFPLLNVYIHKLKGASGSVGCPTIGRTCINFRDYCEVGDKEGCIEALRLVKCEFYRMKANLRCIIQLNEMINSCKEAKEEESSSSSWKPSP